MCHRRPPQSRVLALLGLCAAACSPVSAAPTVPSLPFLDPATVPPAACEDLKAFAAYGNDRWEIPAAVIERWRPGRPVVPDDRSMIERLARYYVRACALSEVVGLTQTLVAFPTVRMPGAPQKQPAFNVMARYLRDWARAAGLRFTVHGDHDAWEITSGAGRRHLSILAHADVPPANGPEAIAAAMRVDSSFEARVVARRVYGRGAQTNKGPLAAALVAQRTLARFGLVPTGVVATVVGTAGGTDRAGMVRYVAQNAPPRFAIAVNARTSVAAAQTGFVAWALKHPRWVGKPANAWIERLEPGPRVVDVPRHAEMVLRSAPQAFDRMRRQVQQAAGEVMRLGARELRLSIDADASQARIHVRSAPIEPSQATAGDDANPWWPLAELARDLPLRDDDRTRTLRAVRVGFVNDVRGERLGLVNDDERWGPLRITVAGVQTRPEGTVLEVVMRGALGAGPAAFRTRLIEALRRLQAYTPRVVEAATPVIEPLHAAPVAGPLVQNLLTVFREVTGRNEAPQVLSRRTYASLFPGGVDFGVGLRDDLSSSVSNEENIPLAALSSLTTMLLEAILRLDAVAATDVSDPTPEPALPSFP